MIVVGLRDSCLAVGSGLGLELALVFPPGWKVLAAGFGLNSCARTLNLLEMAEVGVCMPLDGCEGPVGALRISCVGIG